MNSVCWVNSWRNCEEEDSSWASLLSGSAGAVSRGSAGVTGEAGVCQEDASESGCWDSSWCRRHRFCLSEERDLRMTHLSGETSGSDRDFGSPDDLLPDS